MRRAFSPQRARRVIPLRARTFTVRTSHGHLDLAENAIALDIWLDSKASTYCERSFFRKVRRTPFPATFFVVHINHAPAGVFCHALQRPVFRSRMFAMRSEIKIT